MVNALDGRRLDIQHPDYPAHFLTGRIRVQVNYNDLAHASVTVVAVCDPWLYSRREKVYTVVATAEEQTLTLTNRGRRTVVPQAVVTGDSSADSVLLKCGTVSLAMGPGTYKLPDLLLPTGSTVVTCSGTGAVKISYREAVLR